MPGLLPLMATAQNFNTHNTDTTKQEKEIPLGLHVWTIDQRFGDMTKAEIDTMPHLYPQSTLGMGRYGQFNTLGSNYTARQNRIFADRRLTSNFLFIDAYDQSVTPIDEWHFTNTLSPITNLSYDNCGDKTDGEDHVDARFAVNAGKRTGIGFDLNYQYARGYFQNQSTSHFGATLYASHLGDRYQLHTLFTTHHQKATENGGISLDNYVTHPELYTETYADNEIPTVLQDNWNRHDMLRLFLTHRYSLGFYRKVPMTEEERKAREFAMQAEKEKEMKAAVAELDRKAEKKIQARPDDAKIVGNVPVPADTLNTQFPTPDAQLASDSTRIRVDSKQMADSLLAAQASADSLSAFMKREFVPVTSFIHTLEFQKSDRIYQAYATPANYYANTYFPTVSDEKYTGDSIFDQTKLFYLRNTLAIALLEGFNKYAPAGLKAFLTHDVRRYDMPELDANGLGSLHRWNEHNVSVGGQLQKTQGQTLHYNILAETWVAGEDAGQLKLDATADVNFPFLGDTVCLAAKAYLYRLNPTFLQRRYHSKHLWWDNDFSKETRTRVEGTFTYEKTGTSLRVAVEEMQNYTYLGMNYTTNADKRTALSAGFRQHSGNINVLTAQLDQKLRLGPVHWDNIATYQSSSNKDVLPLPTFNLFSNLYLKFMVAHVLSVELGGSATWFTNYDAPDFLPQLNSFAVQENAASRVTLGEFPFVDLYANLHLKHARFFFVMQNAFGKNLNRQAFLTPHYAQNRSVLHMGVSWNFFN